MALPLSSPGAYWKGAAAEDPDVGAVFFLCFSVEGFLEVGFVGEGDGAEESHEDGQGEFQHIERGRSAGRCIERR